ncbi:MAG: hypothetical protein JXB03_00305, partial [Spirochaetales bacterium]|nr:hypothetical protein [Spirochaetales bacterium]
KPEWVAGSGRNAWQLHSGMGGRFAPDFPLVEKDSDKDLYKQINFFGDWMVHTKLDRQNAKRLIKSVDEIVQRELSLSVTDGKIIESISKLLSMQELKNELISLFEKYSIPIFLFIEPQPWVQCATWLLQDLHNKPIIGSDFTEEEKRTGWGKTARVLRIIADSIPRKEIMWCVEIGPRVHIEGKLLNL